jgi:hypothetical protein
MNDQRAGDGLIVDRASTDGDAAARGDRLRLERFEAMAVGFARLGVGLLLR